MTAKAPSPVDKHSQLPLSPHITLDPSSTLGGSNYWAQFTDGEIEARKRGGEFQVLDLFSEVLPTHLTEQKQIP